MRRGLLTVVILGLAAGTAWGAGEDRVQVKVDFSEADRVLEIMAKRLAGEVVADADWQGLFATGPYQRLKKREASLHRDFTDDDFKRFVSSGDLLKQYPALQRTIAEWKKKDLRSSGVRVLQYLPEQAAIHAKVYPVIKPQHNSFVSALTTDPTIFLYVNPTVTPEYFENTVAHEMHHVGLAAVDEQYENKIAGLSPAAKKVAQWMGAFGEGEAMLAAAGSPDVPINQNASQALKDNWAKGMGNFNQDLGVIDHFFQDVLNGALEGEAVDKRAFEFFGLQGPWYTVGYKMAVIVEGRYGRKALIECMLDPRLLPARYNAAAEEGNRMGKERLALWSPQVLKAVRAQDLAQAPK